MSDTSGLEDPKENPKLMENISFYRKQKIEKCMRKKGRCQSLGAGLLLEYVLRCYGKSTSEITFGENGKPEIAGLYFNLSHSHDIVICAVSDSPIGCDIERMKDAPLRIAERYFGKNECEQLDTLPSDEKSDLFYRLWTIKESYLKMTGEGLQIPLGRIEVIPEGMIQIYRDGECEDCIVREYSLPGYKISVCAKDGIFEEQLETIYIETII